MRVSLVLAAVAAAGLVHASCDVEVSPSGAVRTPRAALARVAELRAGGALPADREAVVRFAPGVYELAETLRLDGVRNVRFIGAGAERTVFSGGRRIGPFTAGADGVWRAKVPAGLVFEQLWVNGRRAQIAKEPNSFYHYVLESSGEAFDPVAGRETDMSRRRFRTDPKALACLKGLSAEELAQASVHVWWAWDAEWGKPVAVEPEAGWVTLRANVGRDFFMWPKWCPRITIENCRGALDAPGEWFLDRKAGEVLYLPLPGERPESTHAVAPALDRILDVAGSEKVAFEGIGFAHNGWCVPEKGFYAHQSAFRADAALTVRDSARIAFRDCRVTATANYGLWFGEGARDSDVRHTWFEDLGAGGIRFGARAWTTNTPPEKVTQRVTADDNVITSGGHVFPAGTGVYLTFAKDCRVTHNEICDLYYSGICCGWHWGYGPTPNRNNELAWNHIHHLGKGVLSDMGFIYTLGDSRGTVVAGNHGHDMFSYGYTGSGGTGLYPDEGSRGILWTSNLVHHTKTSALSQHYGRENIFLNNIFAFSTKPDSSVAGRWRIENHTSLIVSNNVFAWDAGHHAWRGPGGRAGSVKDLVFGSNLWWGKDGVGTNAFNCGSWEKWRADGMDAGSVLADPLFRDWKNGDWRLKPESPAFRIGFREWDYTEAGVRKGDAAWRAKAAAIRPAAYEVAPVPPANPGRRSFRTGFETRRPGTFPNGSFGTPGVGRSRGYVMESTRAHRHGKQALEIRDFKGLATRYWPHFYQYFRIGGEEFRLAFSLRCDEKADLHCAWREWTHDCRNGQYADGPYFLVEQGRFYLRGRRRGADGKWRGLTVAFKEYAPNKWFDLEFRLHVPKDGEPTYDFVFTDAETGERHEEKEMGFCHADCRRPNWIGFLSLADCETVSFIDDYVYENLASCELSVPVRRNQSPEAYLEEVRTKAAEARSAEPGTIVVGGGAEATDAFAKAFIGFGESEEIDAWCVADPTAARVKALRGLFDGAGGKAVRLVDAAGRNLEDPVKCARPRLVGRPASPLLAAGTGRAYVLEPDGSVSWERRGCGNIHGVQRHGDWIYYSNGDLWRCRLPGTKAELVYRPAVRAGAGVLGFEVQADGGVVMAVNSMDEVVELDPSGRVKTRFRVNVADAKGNRPGAHGRLRMIRKTAKGTYLVCCAGASAVREYDAGGKLVWEQRVPVMAFDCRRRANGNTIVSHLTGVTEYTPAHEAVWSLTCEDLPALKLAFLCGVQETADGGLVIGTWANGEPDASRATAFEIGRDKRLRWAWYPSADRNMMTVVRQP